MVPAAEPPGLATPPCGEAVRIAKENTVTFIQVHGIRPRVTVHLNSEIDRLILCAIMNAHRCGQSTAVCFALRTWAQAHGVRPETLAREDGNARIER